MTKITKYTHYVYPIIKFLQVVLYCLYYREGMMDHLFDIFIDPESIEKIQKRIPYMFTVAEIESMRGGKIGMEVGTVRERVIISLLRYKFGKANVNDKLPTTKADIDVLLFKKPISIKTKTGSLSGIKVSWTVDAKSSKQFIETFEPQTDLLLVHIIWEKTGGFYYIPLSVQKKIFKKVGRNNYLQKPKEGTNPRGISYSQKVIEAFVSDNESYKIPIQWIRPDVKIDILQKWDEMWASD